MKANCRFGILSSVALAIACGAASAQTPVVDGRRNNPFGGPNPYGTAIATQAASVIGFENAARVDLCFQSNQSNVAGKGGYNFAGTQSAPNESDPTLVITGQEFSIRLSDIMTTVPPTIRITGFVNGSGHDFCSNQFFRGTTGDSPNLGEIRNVNFANVAGDQFISVDTATRSGTAPTVDGIRSEAAYVVFPQTTIGTAFGSSNFSPARRNFANGSEINGVAAYIYNNGTPMVATDDFLVVHVAGNLETNFNKLYLFIDHAPNAGQNVISNTNPDVSFNALNRMGTNTVENPGTIAPTVIGPGLTFDAGFAPDFWISLAIGGGNATTPPPNGTAPKFFIDSAIIRSAGGTNADGLYGFAGTAGSEPPNLPTAGTPATLNLANANAVLGGITVDSDNSNSDAIDGSGGVGGRADAPGSGSGTDVGSPSAVSTGFEFKINLDGIGFAPGTTNIKVSGIIVGPNYDFMSNQAIGGLRNGLPPTMSMPNPQYDPNNLGSPARNVDFTQWEGDQFVNVAVPVTIPDAPVGQIVDGSLDGGETSFYGTAKWINITNGTGFGDSVASPTFTPGPHRSAGSEMNAVYFTVAKDPSDGNKDKLYGFVAGNLHDFNKLVLFFDTNPTEGQNDLRGDNAGFENFNGGLGGPNGFTFDTTFAADYAISYNLGFDTTLNVARHFADGTQLLTTGGGYGGRFGGGDKTNLTPVCGTIIAREGFGSNSLTPVGGGNRSVNANGSELDALYAKVESDGAGGGTLFLFFAGNVEPGLRSIEMFFDVKSGGQNRLIYSDLDPQAPLYSGNPGTDFSALNRMGGPFQPTGDPLPPIQEGFRFDTGFEADYWFSFRLGPYDSANTKVQIFANYARLRTTGDSPGPLPDNYDRYLGVVDNDIADSFGPGFINGDVSELTQAAINNDNILGVPQGRNSFCVASPQSAPDTVLTGFECAISLADLGFGPNPGQVPFVVGGESPTQIKITAFLNGFGHSNVSNQFIAPMCSKDLGEPRNVNLATIAGNQFVTFPTGTGQITPCLQPVVLGDANASGVVNFADITSVLNNFNNNYQPGTGPGDANGNGIVNFADITTVLNNFNAVVPNCNS